MSEQTPNINLSELKQTLSQNVIHYEPTRIDYTINDSELSELEEIGKTMWKEIFFTTVGIALPSLVNGIVAQMKLKSEEPWTNEIFINYLIGGISLALAVFSAIVWQSNKKKETNIIQKIKNKPQFLLPKGNDD